MATEGGRRKRSFGVCKAGNGQLEEMLLPCYLGRWIFSKCRVRNKGVIGAGVGSFLVPRCEKTSLFWAPKKLCCRIELDVNIEIFLALVYVKMSWQLNKMSRQYWVFAGWMLFCEMMEIRYRIVFEKNLKESGAVWHVQWNPWWSTAYFLFDSQYGIYLIYCVV